jgi:hypothetical protein
MDKKSIDALSNLSDAIDQLSQAIIDAKQKPGNAGNPLTQAVDLVNQLKEINQSLSEIKDDNKKMMSKQDEILKLSKEIKNSKENNNVFSQAGDNKQKIKDGVSSIVVIAVGVLAIGMAFKLIGKVDFLSVVALGLAIPLIALAFSEVIKAKITIKDALQASGALVIISAAIALASMALSYVQTLSFTQLVTTIGIGFAFSLLSESIGDLSRSVAKASIKGLLIMPFVLVAASTAIMASSWILKAVQPVGFFQLLTTIGIAAAFVVLSYGIGKLAHSLKDVSIKGVILLPLVLVTTAFAILGASYLLKDVQPVGFYQLLTTIGIAAAFTVLSYGIGKLASSLKDVSIKGVILLPLVLVTTAMAILGASYFLKDVQPVGLVQLLTSIGIAAVFVVISFGLGLLVKAMSKIDWADILKLPLMMITISGAIWASSHILKDTAVIPFSNLFNIVLFSITLTIATIAVGAAMWIFDKMGLSISNAIKGGLVVVLVALTIMAASQILSMGDYTNFPSIDWALGTGLSIVAFGLSMAVLGFIAISGVGAVALLAGAVAVLGVAATIVGVAEILNMGNFKNFPSVAWSTSVGLSMTAFALGMTLLGGIIVGTFGLGGIMLAAGSNAMLTVAQTIVDVGAIIAGGKFTGGPSKEWAEGIGLALGAFSPVYGYLMQSQVMSIFGGDAMSGEEYGQVMVDIAQSIIKVAGVFNAAGVSVWANAPTKEWAEGVGMAIGAFAPVYSALDKGLGDRLMDMFMGETDKAKQMSDAMVTIAKAIIDVAAIFAASTQQYKGGPSKEWGEGVGSAISGFAVAYAALEEADLEDSDDILEYDGALNEIVNSIIKVARKFNVAGDIFKTSVNKSFFENIAGNIESYLDLIDDVSVGSSVSTMVLNNIVDQIILIAKKFNSLGDNFNVSIPKSFFDSVAANVKAYIAITDSIPMSSGLFGGSKLKNIISDIALMAVAYKKLAKSIGEVGSNLTQLGEEQFNNLKYLTANIAMLSLGDPDQLEANIDLLEEKSETLAETFQKMSEELAKQNDISLSSSTDIKASTSVKTGTANKVTKTNDDLYSALQQIDAKLATIASSANNLASYVDELRGKTKPTITNKR